MDVLSLILNEFLMLIYIIMTNILFLKTVYTHAHTHLNTLAIYVNLRLCRDEQILERPVCMKAAYT